MPESEILDRILNRIDQLDGKFSDKFNNLDHRINTMDHRIDNLDKRFDKVDEKFDRVDERFNQVDNRLDKIDDRLNMVYDQTVRLTLGQTALKMDINEIKNVCNYLNNEVARNTKDIYVIKNEKN